MNQVNQIESSQVPVPIDFSRNNKAADSLNYLLWGLRYAMKSIVREAVEEVLDEREYRPLEEKTITASELCERWNISANTLRCREIDEVIAPLPLPGRKKVYSMKDVLAAETMGFIKNLS